MKTDNCIFANLINSVHGVRCRKIYDKNAQNNLPTLITQLRAVSKFSLSLNFRRMGVSVEHKFYDTHLYIVTYTVRILFSLFLSHHVYVSPFLADYIFFAF